MRKILLLSLVFVFGMVAVSSAQSRKRVVKLQHEMKPVKINKKKMYAEIFLQGLNPAGLSEADIQSQAANNVAASRTGEALPIGTTLYDLQTNSTVCRRVVNHGDGTISAAWTMAQMEDYSDRGTGYAHASGGVWGAPPFFRQESERTGWPNLAKLPNGQEVITTHSGAFPHVLAGPANPGEGDATSSNWAIESNLDQDAVGAVWTRVATSGNWVHMIALTTPSAFGGAEFAGLDGHIVYFRSPDGGATWDKAYAVIPGLDAANYADHPQDSYSIDAVGSTVAVGVWHDWADTKVFTSPDNGDNWETHLVYDFPLDFYVLDDPYTFEDIGGLDPDSPGSTNPEPSLADSLAMLTTDGSGSVLIGVDGVVHVMTGGMWVTDDDYTDGNSNFYPTTSLMMYWNSEMGADGETAEIIWDGLIVNEDEVDSDTAFTICNETDWYGGYFTSLTTHPIGSVDDAGRVYFAFTTPMDNLCSESQQNFNHVHVMATKNNGCTWTDAYDIINTDTYDDVDVANSIETNFPSMARTVDDQLHIIYQQDGNPGHSLSGDMDPIEVNSIYYAAIDVADLGEFPEMDGCTTVGTSNVEPTEMNFNLAPNPASSTVNVTYNLAAKSDVNVSLMTITGKLVNTYANETQLEGNQNVTMNIADVPAGIYLVQIQADNSVSTRKLVIE